MFVLLYNKKESLCETRLKKVERCCSVIPWRLIEYTEDIWQSKNNLSSHYYCLQHSSENPQKFNSCALAISIDNQ